jgi:hypothetical protein
MLLHIVRELGDVTLADLDAPRVRTFIRGLEATRLSSSTVGLVMTTLRTMCETAVADRLMDRDPIKAVNGSSLSGARAGESGHRRSARGSRIQLGGPSGRAASEPARPA